MPPQEFAARSLGPAFASGEVWECTSRLFEPYPGFVAHPYRDYAARWFDGRPVLRGGSYLTQPRIKHPCYRNYFPAHRNDLAAGSELRRVTRKLQTADTRQRSGVHARPTLLPHLLHQQAGDGYLLNRKSVAR